MKILEVNHRDFTLVVECNNLESTFIKAFKKNPQILNVTSYSVNEGEISIYNFESQKLQKVRNEKTYPVIFENKEYFVGITFKEKTLVQLPHIYSKLKEVREKFFYREELGFLAGTINFGNDLGKSNIILRYTKENSLCEIKLEFEVFPIKLNYRSDYDKIVSDIEREYPYLVLDFLKKTYTSFKVGDSPNTDLIWWQVFGGLYADILQSAKLILHKPHSRIIRQIKYVNADRIQRWNSTLEEEYSQFKFFPSKKYLSEHKTLSVNTSENRFFKYAIYQISRKFKKIKSVIERRYSNTISDDFKAELSKIEEQFETISQNPFFRTIDDFQGIKQESLVLQKATGYSTIYKAWIMLKSGIKFLDGIQNVELKNIADLYQIWCFLEIKSVLQNILGKQEPDAIDLAEIQVDDFVFKIERGVKSKVSFVSQNGDVIDLFHDFSFDTSESKKEKSFTVKQRPDILLRITKNDLKDNYVLTYLYDAKYRLASEDNEGYPDLPTEDSINQMHRYRDAIYYVNKHKIKPEKEVIGAYVLFPGTGDLESIKKLDYYKSIESVNIGAFPLRPNDYSNRTLLEEHLKTIIVLDTESILNEVSPQKSLSFESLNPEVLIGIVKKGNQTEYFEAGDNLIYHTGKVKPSKLKDENSGYIKIKSSIKYFAPYYSGRGIKEYYEILDFKIVPRNEIFPNNHILAKPNDYSDRLIISLGKKHIIDSNKFFTCPITVYRYTTLKNIRRPKENKIEVLIIGSSS